MKIYERNLTLEPLDNHLIKTLAIIYKRDLESYFGEFDLPIVCYEKTKQAINHGDIRGLGFEMSRMSAS